MPAHHDTDVDARQRGVVEVHTREGLRHEACSRREAGGVVVGDQVVVDRLRNVDRAQRVVGLGRLFADDAHGVRRVIAADVEEVLDLVHAQHLEDFLAVFQVGFVAGGAECRRGRGGHQFKVVAGFLREVDEVFIDDAAHAVARAVHQLHVAKAPRFEGHADHRLVDHGGRPAALGDENFS
jgi:hypothetical protein